VQAFAQRARSHADRIEALQLMQNGQDLVFPAVTSGSRVSAIPDSGSRR
jgi:hypothetical protein